jgi:CheY-like chemotaxis protein
MIELNTVLQTAPVALVVLDDDDLIRQANEKAVAMGLSAGTTLASYIANLKEKFVDHVRHQPESQLYRLEFQYGEKRCRASFEENNGDFYVWLVDVSEQLVLADQIRRLKHPDSNKMRQINQLAVTAAGYSELLDVILADSDSLGPDKLNTVRQYQHELTKNLSAMHRVVTNNKAVMKKGSVLVADQNDALTELISELLRDEGYKVVGFSDPNTALKYFRVNEHNIQKAVVDEGLICENDASLVTTLQTASPDLGLIVLSKDSDSRDHGKVSKPLDFQVLLEAMED